MGPLKGFKIIELAGIGPGPFAAMLLADLGADVLRIERPRPADIGLEKDDRFNPFLRQRFDRLVLDLKIKDDIEKLHLLIAQADGLIEGFRPGVVERLGIGPDECLKNNPKLVYGRMTGWGQFGPLANSAGHDLNYIALSGALNAIGRKGQPPAIPLALVGDFGGGAMYLTMGMLAALLAVSKGAEGQVVDAAMVDGATSLATAFYGLYAEGQWNEERGTNILDSGAPFYDVYACKDDKWISISAIEPKFFKVLIQKLGLSVELCTWQYDKQKWPQLRQLFTDVFKTRTQEEWCHLLENTDACFAPVLSFKEAPEHAHMKERETLIEVDGVIQPAPAPRFSKTKLTQPKKGAKEVTHDFKAVYERWTLQSNC